MNPSARSFASVGYGAMKLGDKSLDLLAEILVEFAPTVRLAQTNPLGRLGTSRGFRGRCFLPGGPRWHLAQRTAAPRQWWHGVTEQGVAAARGRAGEDAMGERML